MQRSMRLKGLVENFFVRTLPIRSSPAAVLWGLLCGLRTTSTPPPRLACRSGAGVMIRGKVVAAVAKPVAEGHGMFYSCNDVVRCSSRSSCFCSWTGGKKRGLSSGSAPPGS